MPQIYETTNHVNDACDYQKVYRQRDGFELDKQSQAKGGPNASQ